MRGGVLREYASTLLQEGKINANVMEMITIKGGLETMKLRGSGMARIMRGYHVVRGKCEEGYKGQREKFGRVDKIY